ncbi:MAG: hypothetical protein ACI35W_04870 [Anaeroplasmataceae bacterium]
MNFKKVLSIASVASIAVVGLASCKSETEQGVGYNGNINLSLDYKGTAYLTYGRGNDKLPDSYTTVDGKTLVKGSSITPIWQDIAANMGVKFSDAALVGNTTAESMKNAIQAGYKGYQGRQIDILQITTGDEFTSATTNGGFINFEDYKEYLPNLYKWLNTHEVIKDQMKGHNDGIYYTPYFDGVDQVEKGFNMNTEIVEALLDDGVTSTTNKFVNGTYDEDTTLTTVYGGTDSTTTSSYIKSLNNQEIAVYDPAGKVSSITVSFTKDIATIQNELTTKNGKTLTEALKTYIDTVYGEYIGEGKLYSKRSEIFTTASACYNADELIALLRCVKTNPKYLTGTDDLEMTPIFPRTGEQNRCSIFFEMAQMFGLRGTNGENSRYWINANGELVDTMTQEYALDCIEKMNALQQEKLFPTGEKWFLNNKPTGDWRTMLEYGTVFMTYDYLNVAAFNADVKPDGWKTSKMQGVLPPVAKWPITEDADGNKIVGATEEGYSYTRFTEDNRSLKDGGWAICSSVANNPEKLKKCLQIIDYLYSEEGSFLECYGVNYKDSKGTLDYDSNGNATFKNALCSSIATDGEGTRYPVLTTAYTDEVRARTGGTWHDYMTQYLGSCLGVGNIRSNYLESQNTGAMQKVGVEKYSYALGAGAMYMTTTSGTNFFKSVNTSVTYTDAQKTDNDNNAKALTTFWNIEKGSDKAWKSEMLTVIEKGWAGATGDIKNREGVIATYESANNSRLKNTATQWGFGTKYATADQYAYQR